MRPVNKQKEKFINVKRSELKVIYNYNSVYRFYRE